MGRFHNPELINNQDPRLLTCRAKIRSKVEYELNSFGSLFGIGSVHQPV